MFRNRRKKTEKTPLKDISTMECNGEPGGKAAEDGSMEDGSVDGGSVDLGLDSSPDTAAIIDDIIDGSNTKDENEAEKSPKKPKMESRAFSLFGGSGTRFGEKIGRILSQVDFQNCDPETCISVLKIPSMKTYAALNRKLKSCPAAWMEGFLEEGGLEVLLEGVNTISKGRVHLSDAMMLLECVACIRTVMNSRIGLQVITQNEGFAQILIKGEQIQICF